MKKLLHFLKRLFTHYLFLVFALLFASTLQFGEVETYGINKTVGWAYNVPDVQVFNAILYPVFQFIFLFGYLILLLLRRKTNLKISILHFSITLISYFSTSQELFFIGFICTLISIILFFINLIKSHQ